jgi:hypothetical protein
MSKVIFVPRPYLPNTPKRIKAKAKKLKLQLETLEARPDLDEDVRSALGAAGSLCWDLLRPRSMRNKRKFISDDQLREALARASGDGASKFQIIAEAEKKLGITATAIAKRLPSLGFWHKV